jgi:hypothetical protein
MDKSASELDLLIPPSTDTARAPQPIEGAGSDFFSNKQGVSAPTPLDLPPTTAETAASGPSAFTRPQAATFQAGLQRELRRETPREPRNELRDEAQTELQKEIEAEIDWRGTFLRKVRDHRRVSIEELSDYTKIGKNYITAIEEEIFERLPAPVYVRGFLTQIAKYLKLPPERVAAAFVARQSQWQNQKSRKAR